MFAYAYLAYELQQPATVLKNSHNLMKGNNKEFKELLFLSHQEEGLYDLVFNDKTQFEDMLCSIYLLRLLAESTTRGDFGQVFATHLIYRLALFKLIFSKESHKHCTHIHLYLFSFVL